MAFLKYEQAYVTTTSNTILIRYFKRYTFPYASICYKYVTIRFFIPWEKTF